MPIANVFLDQIKAGTKKVEFRSLTDFYFRKLCIMDKEGNYLADKPITHILFQGGYSPTSPRLVVELKEWFHRDSTIPKKDRTYIVAPEIQRD